ncbi:1-acyl-sn-glycerol-3-phosphate acyltransferase delta isoform X4 [Manis javanica]|uniref:1-acyl-sn-glycerol-3-phosphate acyltransferase delta isoform X4 n=1 Tax=Manis javanica TaxID=9974 RepID=UPI003C6CEDE0
MGGVSLSLSSVGRITAAINSWRPLPPPLLPAPVGSVRPRCQRGDASQVLDLLPSGSPPPRGFTVVNKSSLAPWTSSGCSSPSSCAISSSAMCSSPRASSSTPSSSSPSCSGPSTSSSSGRSTAGCPTASPAGSKVLAKKELAYVPIIGWMWYFTEMVFCTRKWEQDRKTVSQSLLRLRDYPEKYFFLIHCEGTRFTEKKHQISMQVAQAKGLPSLKYHLLPRTKGFTITVRSLRNVVSAVYDCTLNFRNNENPTLLGVLNGKKYHADLYVRRIPLEEVPEDEDRCSTWLHKLYQEKDAFQEEYYRTGTFPETPLVPPRRPWTLVNWLVWASLLLYPFLRFLSNMISSGSSLTLASFVLVFFVASMGVRWMIGVTEIDKGSAYGNADSKQKQND